MKKAAELVPPGTRLDLTVWAFADGKTKRRARSKHCELTGVAMKYDESEEIINLHLRPGWTQKELGKTVARYLKKYRPKRWPEPKR